MKILKLIRDPGATIKLLALALTVGMGMGPAARADTTVVYNLGASGSGTFFAGGTLTPWALGALPAGSFLKKVEIHATIDSTDNNNYANELQVLVDPTPATPGGDFVLAFGSTNCIFLSDPMAYWVGGNSGPGNGADSSVNDTKTAPADFAATLDLSSAGLFLGNGYVGSGTGATWSGTVSITYAAPTKVAASFSNLSLSKTVSFGTASVTLGGTLSGPGPVYPANGEIVHVTINGVSRDATLSGGTGTFSVAFPTATIPINATPYPITYTYDGNATTLLNATDGSTSLTISSKIVPTVTAWPAASAITYGQALSTSTLAGGSASVAGSFSFTSPATKPAAVGPYAASATFTPSNTSAYATVVVPGAVTLAVTPQALTLAAAAVTPKTYDGTLAASITGTLTGVVAGDEGAVTMTGTGTFASAGVGNSIAVNAACTLGGAQAGNYSLTQPSGLTGNITRATLTVTANNLSNLLGTPIPALTYTLSGFQQGEDAGSAGVTGAPALATTATVSSPVGSYPITCTVNTLAAANYSFTPVNGTLSILSSLIWAAGSGAWDINNTPNWKTPTGDPIPYHDDMAVIFDDTASGSGTCTVTLGTTVMPTGVTVNNATRNYRMAGSGQISGSGKLTKQGAGSLTLSSVNTYSGGTTVSGGKLIPNVKGSLGSGQITLAGGVTFNQSNANGTGFEGNGAGGAYPNTFYLSGGPVTFNVAFGDATDVWTNTPISGPGSIVVVGGGRAQGLTLQGNNTFTGGLTLGTPNSTDGTNIQLFNVNSLGTGTLRTELKGGDLNSGGLRIQADLSAGVANPIELVTNARLVVNTFGNNALFAGPISGGGKFVKINTGTVTLSGANTATGGTKVVAGTLACASAFSLSQGLLDISSGAKVQLNFTGTRRIPALTLGGAAQTNPGIYGSSTSGAPVENQNDSYFGGTGTVTVGLPGATSTTTLALTSGTNPATVGTSLTFTATVAGTAPTGNVTFYAGATRLGTGPVALNGALQASITTSSLALGSYAITARYEGDAVNDPSVSAGLAMQVANPADILTFVFPGLPATTISGNTISVSVPYATVVTGLAPSYTLSPGATCDKANGGPTTYDFTNPVTYTVTASDLTTTKPYTVTVTKAAASTAKDLTTFVFAGLPATSIGSNTVALTVPFGTPVSSLSPTYTVSSLAVPDALYPSGCTRDFTNPQTYTIKAQDGSTKIYTVSVTVAPASPAKDILTCDFGVLLGAATVGASTVTLTVPPGTDVSALAPTFTLSPLANISPASGTPHDFTTAQTYTVTAQDLTTKTYSVKVQTSQAWAHTASLFIITTPEGANLPASATETHFPLLVRLNASTFNFSQAQPDGRDLRFTTPTGAALPYQIEEWNPAAGTASIWVKIPAIAGNARQEIKLLWGNPDVISESNGGAVFNAANGYVSVLHMNESVQDVVGSVSPSDTGTTPATGMIGKARNFTAGKGVNCGENLTILPGGSTPSSSEAWIRATAANTTVLGWGIEQYQGKVVMQVASPPHINMDCYFSGANVSGAGTLPLSQWVHVAHTYKNGEARLYVNGVLDGTTTGGTPLNVPSPARMYLGGWYGNYNFAGDMDEVRLSKVTRSADWIKLEYENQKLLQTLVGTPVQAGTGLSVAPATVTMNENSSTNLTASAGGAQKVYWFHKLNGVETLLAVDQLALNFAVGRVSATQASSLLFKAVYPLETKVIEVPVTVTHNLPDPQFTLTGSATWDGRQTLTVTANVSNLGALQAAGLTNLNYAWSVAGVAVTKQISPGVLTLTRAQGSGPMSVTLVMDNGGALVTQTKTISVQEPATDAWVQRTPAADEKPLNGQFFARDDTGKGYIYYNGSQDGSPDAVFLKVYTTTGGTEVLYNSYSQALSGGAYAFTAPIAAGKVTYKVVYGTSTGGVDTPLATVTDLVCGDAYIIDGQSNAVATDGLAADATNSQWIRTYGQSGGGWGNAVRNGTQWWIGYWGFDLALNLSATHNLPICIINGAVGGTRIDQHQANPADHSAAGSSYSIYASLLNRVAGAKLTHGIRGIFWHQGENNSGAAAPTGDWDYKSYQQYFVDMAAAWKQDYPNVQRYIIYQVWPNPCSMGGREASDMLREVQRTLPRLFSKMSILSTLGLPGYLGCHFSADGYQAIADLTAPLVERDHYGATPAAAVTAPNLQRAYFTTSSRNEIALEFDQNMFWNNSATSNFYLDRVGGQVTTGGATGHIVTLQLSGPTNAQTLDYVVDQYWNGSATNLLTGTNAISALTFYAVPITLLPPTGLTATPGDGQVTLTWSATTAASGYRVKRATTSSGPYTEIGTPASASFSDTTATNGTTYYYVVAATNGTAASADSAEASAMPTGTTTDPYAIWIASKQLSGADSNATADPDHDGLPNSIEFVLGGEPNPANPDSNSRSLLPSVTRNPDGSMAFTFHRTKRSTSSATLTFQWSTDLSFPLSNNVAVAAASSTTNGVTVDVTEYSPDTDLIVITVPANKAPDGKLFGRLGVALQSGVPSATVYETWIATSQLGGAEAAFTADPDQDGLTNLLEFVIGSEPNPARPGADSRGLLPTVAPSAGNLVFTYRRSATSLTQPGIAITAEYGSNLTTWTPAQHGVNGVSITTTPDGFGAGIDKVEVSIPQSLATGTMFFVHLKVTVP